MRRVLLAVIAALFSITALASSETTPSRIIRTVNHDKALTPTNQVPRFATAQNDRGAAPADLPMERMRLVLRRSEEQQTALRRLLQELQTPGSPNYHKWLSPEEFGRRFGPPDSAIETVVRWLQSHGFTRIHVTKGRTLIEFSGTAGLVQQAFHTSIHKYVVNGASYWANASAPQIPEALSPFVVGIARLDNFLSRPQHVLRSDGLIPATYRRGPQPQMTFPGGLTALTPGDLGIIYNSVPLVRSGVTGAGTAIAVIGRSNIDVQDIADFRRIFGLPDNPVQIIVNGRDPGRLGGGEELEAVLDNEYAGSLAPEATIKFVVSASTYAADGVELSQIYAIDNNVADIMTVSFGLCEWYFSPVMAEERRLLAEQAAAQGITYLVSSGDSGSAGCALSGEGFASDADVYVNMLASPPDVVAVGGTQFNEHGSPSAYWSDENDPTTLASALSYIPEEVWNESCEEQGCGGPYIAASGGGASVFFPKPSWQAGVPGIPAEDARYLPDVSLSGAWHDFYLVCAMGSCQPDPEGFIHFWGVAGTSASAPTFASIMALVNQATNSRQGNANQVLYRLAAAQDYSQCNGSDPAAQPASTCVFQDATIGHNAVPGMTGYGTPEGKYQAGVGYDLATGLGSVNVTNLANAWKNRPAYATVTTMTINPTDTVHGTGSEITINVTSDQGVPTGNVAVLPESGPAIGIFKLNEAGSASGTAYLPGGTYRVTAHYAGDGAFTPSDSEPVTVSVSPEPANLTLKSYVWNPVEGRWDPSPIARWGQTAAVFVTAKGVSGNGRPPTGDVHFSFDGTEVYAGPLDPDGTLGIQWDVMPPLGDLNVTADYVGDRSYEPASTSLVFPMKRALSTTMLESSRSVVRSGDAVTFTAVVSSNVAAPWGSVTFYSGANRLSDPIPLLEDPSGSGKRSVASFTTAGLAEGQNIITAAYDGSEGVDPSTSAPIIVTSTSQIPTTTSVTASNSSVVQNTNVTFTAKVFRELAGAAMPTGTVQFAVDSVAMGSPVVLNSEGAAQYSTASLPVGQHIVSATYSGDTVYVASSGSVSINVTPQPSFTVAAGTSTINVAKGSSATGTVDLAATNGFIGSVALTCAVTPVRTEGPTCSLTPTSVSLDTANTTAQSVVTVATTGTHVRASVGASGMPWWATGAFGIVGLALLGVPARRRRMCTFMLVLMLVVSIIIVGCGGGSETNDRQRSDSGTPVGAYTIVVTASSGGLPPQTTTVTVNVR